MKRKLLTTCLCLLSLTATSCDFSFNGNSGQIGVQLTELPTPEISNDSYDPETYTISWASVSNCDGYTVKIDTKEYNTTALSYTVSFNESRNFTFSIKARGKAMYTSDSPWSETFTWHYEKQSNNNDNPSNGGNTETGETFLQTGIGYTVDVIAADNYNDYKKGVSVLDRSKLNNASFDKKINNSSQIKVTSNESISDFISNSTIATEVKVDSKSKFKTMFNNINVGLKSSASFDYSSYSQQYFYSLDSYIGRYTLSLVDYTVNGKYTDYLSANYLNALETLHNNYSEEKIIDFYETYGTHLIASGVFGGRLNAYYSTVTNKATIDSSVSTQLKMAVEAGISAVNNTSVSTDVSSSIKEVLKTSEFETAFYAIAYGGNAFAATTIDTLNSNYTNWTASLNNESKDAVLIDYSNDGLIPLWNMLPSKYQSMSTAMQEAFITYYQNSYDSLIANFSTVKGNDYNYPATLLYCSDNNGYDYTKTDNKKDDPHYNYNNEFGSFVVKNVKDMNGKDCTLMGTSDSSVYFKVKYDCDNLPLQDTMTSRSVSHDTFSVGYYNMPGGDIGNKECKKGIMVVYITYEDGTIASRTITEDVFNGKKAGDEILIASDIKKPCKIEVAICFELVMWAPGFLGISDDYWVNYRINETLNFKN